MIVAGVWVMMYGLQGNGCVRTLGVCNPDHTACASCFGEALSALPVLLSFVGKMGPSEVKVLTLCSLYEPRETSTRRPLQDAKEQKM